ncbi:chaperonin [Enterobacter cloacae]|nr:chaperonin [Enterobacter cloacae]
MSKITERLKHVRIDEGYCNICGNFGRLTRDHVPPKSACKPEKMLQKSVVEYFSLSEVRPLDAKIGTTFKTICIKCNNDLLGSLDNEIGKVTKEFTLLLKHYFKGTPFPSNIISFKADVVAFTRAMVGHLLAATSVTDCQNPPVDSPFYTPLKQFVLGKNEDIHATHDFYYWFYPHKLQITAQTVGFYNNGHNCVCSCLHFYPLAFLITQAGQGTFPAHATQLTMNDKKLYFNMTSSNFKYVSFPFVPLEGNQMTLMSSGHTCVSYPSNK